MCLYVSVSVCMYVYAHLLSRRMALGVGVRVSVCVRLSVFLSVCEGRRVCVCVVRMYILLEAVQVKAVSDGAVPTSSVYQRVGRPALDGLNF